MRSPVRGLVIAAFVLLGCGQASDASREDPAATAAVSGTTYSEVLAGIEDARRELGAAYDAAGTAADRAEILDRARRKLVRDVTAGIFPRWYGTPWDFNGVTEIPGEGAIACGYFVTTVLRDAGFRLQRVRLAQVPSETMIRSLVPEDAVRRFSNVSLEDFVAAVRDEGPGLYIVGLDIHTGFLLNQNGEVSFVHASYVPPREVFREPALDSPILGASRYRVLGTLTGNDAVMRRWLAGAPARTVEP